MEPTPRYEIVDTIATRRFRHGLSRPRPRAWGARWPSSRSISSFSPTSGSLARYWQEAQLLASLQHPNIVTIYDIVRSRGWLILELMRGSLKQAAQGEPIDLDFLRVVLVGQPDRLALPAPNGVIHGDIKPSNLLVDGRNRVKIGDFGLARRASNEGGSLLKGTTKYMAPELIHPQFGAGRAGQRPLFAGLLGLRVDVRGAVRVAVSRAGRLRPRQADRLDDVARGRRPQTAGNRQGAARACRTTWPASSRRWSSRTRRGAIPSAAEVLADLRPDPRLAEPLPVEN